MNAFLIHIAFLTLCQGLPVAAQSPHMLRTGYPLHGLNNVDKQDAKVAMGHLLKEIVEKHDVGYTTEIVEDPAEYLGNVVSGAYDFFLVFGYDYLQLRDRYPMRPILVGQHDESRVLEEFLFLTAQTTKSLTDLEGATLLIPNGTGELSELWLDRWLASQNLKGVNDTFSSVETTVNVSKAILPVFFGKADACVVPRSGYEIMNELNPQIGIRTTIHARSKPLLKTVLCLSPVYVEKEKGLVQSEGLRLNELPKGEQLITLLRMKKLIAWDESFLTNLEELISSQPPAVATASGQDSNEE